VLSGEASISSADSASTPFRVLFESSAALNLFDDINWGDPPNARQLQRAGLLIGNVYRNTSTQPEFIWANVIAIEPADPLLMRASSGSIDAPSTVWKRMIYEASAYQTENLRVLGWYHTHLDQTPAHFSDKDRYTHRTEFGFDYSLGVVLNPNRRQWSAVYGPNSLVCLGEIAYGSDMASRYDKPSNALPGESDKSVIVDEHLADSNHWSVQPEHETRSRPRSESARQTISRWFSRMSTDIRQKKASSRTGADPRKTNSSHAIQPIASNHDETRGSAGRIGNRTSPVSRQTVTNSMMFMQSSDLRLVPMLGFQVLVTDKSLETISRSWQESPSRQPLLWAQVQVAGATLVLSLVPKKYANALVAATSGVALSAIQDHLVSREFDHDLEYFVGIDVANSQQIVLRMIQLSSGAKHE
jgi:hypothetical protein